MSDFEGLFDWKKLNICIRYTNISNVLGEMCGSLTAEAPYKYCFNVINYYGKLIQH